ncbi:bifunctional glutamate N-acetyltransferase/amino-acid acetyltransferase ArgJ [Staphylococcus caprae]
MKVIEGNIASPLGFSADGLHAGFKRKKLDFGWIVSEVPANVAGVFTTNKVIAAPLILTQSCIENEGQMQAIVVNSGIANSCTGEQGLRDAQTMQQWAAEKLHIKKEYVGVASTGVIGEMMPMNILENGFSKLVINGNADDFAKSILTTDKDTKTCVVTETFDKDIVTTAGVAKGSGMIHPNMATMLAFITCDANISTQTLQQALSEIVQITFNQITVDGDTSTNDMVIVMSNGCTNNKEILPNTSDYTKFKAMLFHVMQDLAKKIAKDGEGATKLIEVNVTGAQNSESARMIAKCIVGSSLVKTAIFGEDPNWGRIIAAAGYADTTFNPNQIDIAIGNITVLSKSTPIHFDKEEMQDIMSKDEVTIHMNLNGGQCEGKAWGCDLSYDYVKINELYTT